MCLPFLVFSYLIWKKQFNVLPFLATKLVLLPVLQLWHLAFKTFLTNKLFTRNSQHQFCES